MYKTLLLMLLAVAMQVNGSSQGTQKEAKTNAAKISGVRPGITGMLGAFPPEILLLKEKMQDKTDTVIRSIVFTQGTLFGKRVVLAQTGIGKVNAAIATTILLEHFMPQRLIFSGIAGGINPALRPGDIVVGTRVAYHDYGILTADSLVLRPTKDPGNMSENPVYFPCDSALVELARLAAGNFSGEKISAEDSSYLPRIVNGTIVTGDVFVGSDIASRRLWRSMQAQVTEMEGAAVAQTCWQQHVPFLVIRSLSDNANNKAAADVRTFYAVAARNSAQLVMEIIKRLR